MKISVTLPKELLSRIDRIEPNRSAFVERASRVYLASVEESAHRDSRDLAIINANADRLNAEAADALEYQQGI